MLQVARLAPRLLGESTPSVESFLRGQIADDGGFLGRGGSSDLYYTVFGVEGLLALRADLPLARLAAYLRSFGDGSSLDLVHAACLARAWAALPPEARREAPTETLSARLLAHRSRDGGFAHEPGAAEGTVYALFLAAGALQDLGQPLPSAGDLRPAIERLRARDGGFANHPGAPEGQTPATAAAAALLRHFGDAADPNMAAWLLARAHVDGGFFASPSAPAPDLLSTAVALHALAGLHAETSRLRERCLDFLDTLWTSRGGFYGHWADDAVDCEYTYYGLLALGHLSLAG